MSMNLESWFESRLSGVPVRSALAVIRLSEEGGTVPFIARYRKEATGNLDEVAIRDVIRAKETWDETIKRQKFILGEIEAQKKLTPELKKKIESTFDLHVLEDLYLPYKKKRKTKAQKARDAGLGPLAEWIWKTAHGEEKAEAGQTPEKFAEGYIDAEKEIPDAAAALQGAQDILTERLAENQELRQIVRGRLFKEGVLGTSKGEKAKEHSKFQGYFEYREPVESLMKPENSHRYLAIRRGWTEGELKLNLGGNRELEAGFLERFQKEACPDESAPGSELLKRAAQLALKVYVLSSIESEVHKALKEVADEAAIRVFSENVRKLLLAAPFGSKAVLGVDPGVRTGCKAAVVSDSGKHLGDFVFKFQGERDLEHAKVLLSEVVKNAEVRAVAVGNGTAGRETETFIRETLQEKGSDVPVVMVSEAGASVYSASDVAREEFPDLDLTVRGAISIARRLQDPLAELVKVDPKSIGVGQYQHDVSPHQLKRSLDDVVDSCVNAVGVELNTASRHLLAHVAGIGPALAKSIVERRDTQGLFRSRQELLEVPRFSQKVFEQAAGFLRVRDGENPLDNTGVHPERYGVLEKFAASLGKSVSALLGEGAAEVREARSLKDEVGEYTFADIVEELGKPGRDPREEFVPFQFRADIHEVKDLKEGMECPGIVTNVTNFGAFVDIGVHQDGLVHISQLADKFVKDPRLVVSPGDQVKVRVMEVDADRKRIALTMRRGEDLKTGKAPGPKREGAPRRKPKPAREAGAPGGKGKRPERPPKQPRKKSQKPRGPQPDQKINNAFAGLAGFKVKK